MTRKKSLHESTDGEDLKNKTPPQLIGMMWQLALNAWAFKENLNAEPRVQKHIVVLKRRMKSSLDKNGRSDSDN
ncbi:MAG TPA: hypothetical protein VGC91_17915 [Pyrinomonadaceae bacterium]